MAKYKRYEIELTPKLMKRLLEYSRMPTTTPEELDRIVENLCELSKSDETLTIEEYDHIIAKKSLAD